MYIEKLKYYLNRIKNIMKKLYDEIEKNISSIEPVLNEENKIKLLEEELSEYKNKILYLMADVENIKRNSYKEIASTSNKKCIKILSEILIVYENFSKCIQFEPLFNEPSSGINLIYKSFEFALKNIGVEEIKEKNKFDPKIHEAISFIDSTDKESGQIIEVIKKGYIYNDAIIYPSQVIVVK